LITGDSATADSGAGLAAGSDMDFMAVIHIRTTVTLTTSTITDAFIRSRGQRPSAFSNLMLGDHGTLARGAGDSGA
jgi:hypothetical protein